MKKLVLATATLTLLAWAQTARAEKVTLAIVGVE